MVSSVGGGGGAALRESNRISSRRVIGGDAENHVPSSTTTVPYLGGPTPIILTNIDSSSPSALSPYRTVLAIRPDVLPPVNKRELRDAVRCARSGMVPGAMRKYLQAKRQPEEEELLGENNNNDIDDSVEQCELNNNDDVEIFRTTSTSDVHVNDLIPSSSEIIPSNNNSSMSRKRHFSEAFSPDTTTHTDNEQQPSSSASPSQSPSSSSTSFSETKVNVNTDDDKSNGSSNDRFEIQFTTPAKKPNNKKSPSSPPPIPPVNKRKGRKAKKAAASLNTSTSTSKTNSACRNLLSSIDVLPSSSSFSLSLSSPSSYQISESIDLALEKALSRHSWANVIQSLSLNLEASKLLPHPRHVGLVIRKALLGVGVRVPRDIPAAAQAFVAKLASVYPIDADGDNSTKYYVDVFTQSGDEEVTSKNLPTFLATLLDVITADVRAGTSPAKALPFFKLLTRLVVTQYKAHEKLVVKLHRPFFVRFLEDEEGIKGGVGLNYNGNCRCLLRHMFELINHPQELEPLLRWIGLLSHHLKDKHVINSGFSQLVQDFVDTVSRPEHLPNQIKIVQAIKDKALGSSVCMSLLTKSLHFEYISPDQHAHNHHHHTNNGHHSPPKESPSLKDITRYFKNIAKSKLILSLKAGLEEKSNSKAPTSNSWQSPPPSAIIATPSLPNSSSASSASANRRRPSGVNMKGESHLHKLCAKSTSDAAGLELERFLKQRAFPVNPRDNFGNTPLHDAVAHSRLDALMKFYEFSAEQSLPHDIRIDILAQNDNGDNAFHLAASLPTLHNNNNGGADKSEPSTPRQLIDILKYIADKLNATEEALKSLNKDGLMPFQMTASKEIREALLPPDGPEVVNIPPEGGGVKVSSRSRVALQSIEVKRLIALWSEFAMC